MNKEHMDFLLQICIHGDGNLNVINASMFDRAKWIEKAKIKLY